MTSVIALRSIGLACLARRLHLELASGFRGPNIPHLIFCGPNWNKPQMGFVPTPLRHTAQGSLSDFWSPLSPGPDIKTFALPMLTRGPFPSLSVFQRYGFSQRHCVTFPFYVSPSEERVSPETFCTKLLREGFQNREEQKGDQQEPWRTPTVRLLWDSLPPIETLHLRGTHNYLSRQLA